MTTTESEKLKQPNQVGLNDLLASPGNISELTSIKDLQQAISPDCWRELNKLPIILRPLLIKSIELDLACSDKVYTVEMGADNGILFAFQNRLDSAQTTTIYISSHGKELSDWGPGLRIAKDRVLCHDISIVSRRLIGPNIYTASQIKFRMSTDFLYVEGDPTNKHELESRGLYSDNKTFLFNTHTRSHTCFIEVVNPEDELKTLAPLVSDIKQLWMLVADAGRGEIFGRLLTGKLKDEDKEYLMRLNVDLESEQIDMDSLINAGINIADDLLSKANATLRSIPTTYQYLIDLRHNLLGSKPMEITRSLLPATGFDLLGIGRQRYLEKRAAKVLGKWKEAPPQF